jgi:hypothetical protein
MDVRDLIRNLRAHPGRYLDPPCLSSLDAFLGGYICVEESLFPAWDVVRDTFLGQDDSFGFCTRAYLAFQDESEGMERVLQALEDALPSGPLPPVPGSYAHRTFPSILLEMLDQKHSALVLGSEQTISRVYHKYQGHLAGTEALAPAEGAAQRQQLQEFDTWLHEQYDAPHAKWHRILRVFEQGETLRGVEKFAQLWRDFESGVPAKCEDED